MRKLKIFLGVLFSCYLVLNAFGQENKADRYLNAYKAYLDADCPIEKDNIKHFVYFARDRKALQDHPLLSHPAFEGAQIMYPWAMLEKEKDKYDFTIIREDYNYLQAHGKKLFIQLQDVTFSKDYNAVPEYLLTNRYGGGVVMQKDDEGNLNGWAAKRWNPEVQNRFAALLKALANEFDGKIEGINLQETAIYGVMQDSTCTPELYVQSIKNNILALKETFHKSVVMQYANFMPGEWLPWDDNGYLLSIYKYGQEIGVGLGAPDLMVKRRGQLNHTIAMMHEHKYTVPLGIAIQDGNYIGKTGADKDYNEEAETGKREHNNIVPLLHAFAKDFLHINYMFWVYQEPYFTEDVIPCFER